MMPLPDREVGASIGSEETGAPDGESHIDPALALAYGAPSYSLVLAGPEPWRIAVEQLIDGNASFTVVDRVECSPLRADVDSMSRQHLALIAVDGNDPNAAMEFADAFQTQHQGSSLALVLPNMSETYIQQFHARNQGWSLISAGASGQLETLTSVLERAAQGVIWIDPVITQIVQSIQDRGEQDTGSDSEGQDDTADPNASRILITDDNDDVRMALKVLLEDLGYEVMEAGDGEEAIGLARAFKPDLILLDVMMPKMNGFTALEQLKSDPESKDIPVVMVTARKGLADEQTARDLGAFDYLHKPWADGEVEMTVNWALTRQHKPT